MGLLSFLDGPRSRKKKHRKRSAWIEEEHRHIHKRNATHRCAQLHRQGYRCKIVTLPNGTHVVFKKER